MHHTFAKEREEDAGVLWMAHQGVRTSAGNLSFFVRSIYLTPAGDQQHNSEDDYSVADGHRSSHRPPAARQINPEIAIPKVARNIQIEDAGEQVDRDGKSIHLGIKCNDERLHDSCPSPFPPTFRHDETVETPRHQDD